MSGPATTLPATFWRLAAERRDATLLRQKRLGIWEPWSWRAMAEVVGPIAAGLTAIGIRPGEVVAILAGTGRDWLAADLGAQTAGAIVAGLHVTEPAAANRSALAALGPRVLFVEDQEQFDDLVDGGALPAVEHVIVFRGAGLRRAGDARLTSLHDLVQRGAQVLAADSGLIGRVLASRQAKDAAAIVATSGATGAPKAARLSHAALLAACGALPERLSAFPPRRRERVLFLPPGQAIERVGVLYASLLDGAVLNFVESQDTILDNLREVQPDMLLTVPRIWERLHSGLALALGEATRLQRWAYARALAAGARVASAREQGQEPPAWLRLVHGLADRLVLGNLRRMMGLGRLRTGVAGGAPISPQLVRWYRAMGIDLRQGWGLAETAGYAAVAAGGDPPESVGRPLRGMELRLSADGEVLVRGAASLSGWHGEGTHEPGPSGWIGSGDLGRLDDAGRLSLTGRCDEVIRTAQGQQVLPAELENGIKSSPYIADAVVIGDGRPHLSCLVLIDQEAVEQWAQDRQVPFSDFRSLCTCREVVDLVAQEIERAGAQGAQRVAAFRLIDTPADMDAESLTPAMKLRRWRILERHRAAIDTMYAASAA